MKFSPRRRCPALCLSLLFLSVAAAGLDVPRAKGSTATVAITGGGLTVSNPSVTVIGRNPVELDVRASVTDARGTGAGWFLSVGAGSLGDSGSQRLVVTGGRAECESGSGCTPARSDVQYPLPVSVTGARKWAFEAEPSSGLGAQTVDLFITTSPGVSNPLNLSLSISTQPPGSEPTPASAVATGPQLPPCSIREMTATGTCQTTP
ncbi:MAG TPA: hypothetical protein VGF91_03045 [Solirubrobacteraceae bacterium]